MNSKWALENGLMATMSGGWVRKLKSGRSFWVNVLVVCRPLWQMAILLLYSLYATTHWQQALVGTAGSVVIAANLVLSWELAHVAWQRWIRIVLLVEATVMFGAGLAFVFVLPLGPAALLLLPTLITYAWLLERDAWEYVIAVSLFFLLAVAVPPVWRESASHALGAGVPDPLYSILILLLYAVLTAVGGILAFLLQNQRYYVLELEQSMRHTEFQTLQINRRNRQMTDYANQVHDLASAQERNKIAGEIHDTVTHRLTALIVQLQVARRFLQGDRSSEDAIGNLQVCEALARESLEEVRRSVRAMQRPTAGIGMEALRKLTQDFAVLTGMAVEWSTEFELPGLPTKLITVLYRVLEEALTNASRHGHATRVQVAMAISGGHLAMQIDDNGIGAADVQYGFGLSSTQDRLRQIGAELSVESAAGSGFSLKMKVPLGGIVE